MAVPSSIENRIYLDHPEFEIVEEEGEENIHMGRITPIYPLTEGVRQRALRVGDLPGHSRTTGAATQSLCQFGLAVRGGSAESDSFPGQLCQLGRRRERSSRWRNSWPCRLWWNGGNVWLRRLRATVTSLPERLTERFLAALPYRPTAAQERAIREIRQDMAKEIPMSRLLARRCRRGQDPGGRSGDALCG